jgi:EAL domain-containing protein (putative c-di-GMP-specific phosphodiesterase class I)
MGYKAVLDLLEDMEIKLARMTAQRQGQSSERIQHLWLASQLISALKEKRFGFAVEPWHGVGNSEHKIPLPMEFLLRIQDKNGGFLPTGPAVGAFRELGLARELDLILIPAMVDMAMEYRLFPISVNVSSSAAAVPQFWEILEGLMRQRMDAKEWPRHLIFEIVDDAFGSDDGRNMLFEARSRGARFAVDDFTPADRDLKTTDAICKVVEYLKIDGSLIDSWSKGGFNLQMFVEDIRKMHPNALLVAEWVQSPDQAALLAKRYGILGAQGRLLPRSRGQFSKALAEALDRVDEPTT